MHGHEKTAAGVLIDKGTLDQGGSVAHMSLSLANHLGCNPIMIIGQDLSIGETSHIPLADVAGTIEVTKKDHNDTKNDLEGTKQELIDAKKEIEKLKETIKFLVTKEDFSLLSGSIRKQLEATSSELNGKLDVKSLEVEKKLLESSSEVFVPKQVFDGKLKELESKFSNLLNLVMKKLG
jgi:hypothetical protein